jgi:mRNA-degrading endonuclease toxin of MazEF toxin-antitoxin module
MTLLSRGFPTFIAWLGPDQILILGGGVRPIYEFTASHGGQKPTHRNGLKIASRLMIDKVTTVPKSRLGKRIGKLGDEDLVRLNRALTVFLGLAS